MYLWSASARTWRRSTFTTDIIESYRKTSRPVASLPHTLARTDLRELERHTVHKITGHDNMLHLLLSTVQLYPGIRLNHTTKQLQLDTIDLDANTGTHRKAYRTPTPSCRLMVMDLIFCRRPQQKQSNITRRPLTRKAISVPRTHAPAVDEDGTQKNDESLRRCWNTKATPEPIALPRMKE